MKNENEIDRARAQQTIADLEKRLTELHDQLMSHSKEFVNARDAQASLRSEIETYRTLLNEESNKYVLVTSPVWQLVVVVSY